MATKKNKGSSSKPQLQKKMVVYVLFILGGITAGVGAIFMTDIGQIFGIEKSVIVWYFKYSTIIILISLILLVTAIFIANKNHLQSKKWSIIFSITWLLLIATSKYLTPYILFRAQQYNAKYIPISEAEGYLEDTDRVLVVNYNDVQKAYPPENIWQAHIFGGDFGNDNVIFSYCVMTNLASAYLNEIDDEGFDFKVLAQANNNLLIWDTKRNDIIQQITQEYEFSKRKLEPLPVLEMTWEGYKKLFPNGTVLYNTWNTPVEKIVSALFSTEDTWHGDNWMFNTANLDDKRLPSKEHIVGIRDDLQAEQLAFTKDFIKNNGIYNFDIGNRKLVISYFPEYETIACFDRVIDEQAVEITKLDVFGESPQGKLKQVYIYNSVLWAVWAHYYPNSKVLKND